MIEKQSFTTFYKQINQNSLQWLAGVTLLFFIADHEVICYEIFFYSIWFCCFGFFYLPSILPMPGLRTMGTEEGGKKVLMLCRHTSEVASTLLCYQLWFSHKSKLQWLMGFKEKKLTMSHLTQHTKLPGFFIVLFSVCFLA